MTTFARSALSFLLAVLLFLTLVITLIEPWAGKQPAPEVQNEGIISQTSQTGYPKYLDSLYYTIGSVVIPLSAFGFWQLFVRKWKWLPMMAIACAWMAIAVLLILRS